MASASRGRRQPSSRQARSPAARHAARWRGDHVGGIRELPPRLVDLTLVGAEQDHPLSQPLERQRQETRAERPAGVATGDALGMNVAQPGCSYVAAKAGTIVRIPPTRDDRIT